MLLEVTLLHVCFQLAATEPCERFTTDSKGVSNSGPQATSVASPTAGAKEADASSRTKLLGLDAVLFVLSSEWRLSDTSRVHGPGELDLAFRGGKKTLPDARQGI